jgi:hypothetical protein
MREHDWEQLTMRTTVAKEVRKQFAERLNQKLPGFRAKRNEHVSSGERLFEWRAAPGLSFFLLLQPADDYDEFTIEVSWSTDGDYPMRVSNNSPYEPSRKGKMRFRLCSFWTEEDEWFCVSPRPSEEHLQAYFFGGGTDYYPESPEEAVQRVPGLIEEVFRRIHEHAVPYFHKIAEDLGKVVK